MEGNGIATMRLWPVTIELGGGTHRIPAAPAIRWVLLIVDDRWFGIVPGMLDDTDTSIDDGLDDGRITHNDCLAAARDAVAAASGLKWWSAVRLVMAAVGSPEIMGELLLRGVDPERVSLGAFVQAIYRIFVRDADKKQRAKIDSDLTRVPEGLSIAERSSLSSGASGFEQMMQQRGG